MTTTSFSAFIKKAKDFITKHANTFCIAALLLFGYLFLFLNLGSYRLIDIDETRYINIARAMFFNGNFVTPELNFEAFLEKPPLFYWLTALSYKLFNNVDEFASRFPVALTALATVFGTYFFGKKALGSKIYGLVAAMILLSCIWFGLFSHIAIMDIGFTAFVTASIYCAVITLFNVKDENKKYFWYLSYLFMGLGVLQKGLIGVILPVMVIVLTFIALNRWKELIKPVNIIPGLIIFLLVSLPWHILAYKANGAVFIEDYFVKHHFARFLNSSLGLGRKQPFLFFIPILAAGLLPWTFSFISAVIRGIKSLIKDFKATKSFRQIVSNDTNDRKLLIFATIYAVSILLFFSISSTKLPTYILPLFPALALITGYYWWGYIVDNKFQKGIKISTIVSAVFFILLGIAGALALVILTGESLTFAKSADSFRMLMSSWLIVISLITLLCLISKNRSLLFIANVILMLGVSIITSGKILNYTTTFGQTELEAFAGKAQMVSGSKLVTLGFGKKYSVLNNSKNKVYFITKADNKGYNTLKTVVLEAKKEGVPVYLIIRKDRKYAPDIMKGFTMLEDGIKYELYMK